MERTDDALRASMIQGGQSSMGLGVDLAVESGGLLLLVVIGARLYPTAVN